MTYYISHQISISSNTEFLLLQNIQLDHKFGLSLSANHYGDDIMGVMASQVTSLTIVSPATGEFPAQMASNAENVSIWWRHHVW